MIAVMISAIICKENNEISEHNSMIIVKIILKSSGTFLINLKLLKKVRRIKFT